VKFEPPREGDTWRKYTKREAKRLRTTRRRVVKAMKRDKQQQVGLP
jgi:hypothetical protein